MKHRFRLFAAFLMVLASVSGGAWGQTTTPAAANDPSLPDIPAALPSNTGLTGSNAVPMQQAPLPPQPTAAEIAAAKAKALAAAQAEMQREMYTVTGVPATYGNVLKAAIRFGAVDMSTDEAIDDFAKVLYCPMYQKYRSNEFDWRKVRVALRKKIEIDKPTYPTVLYLERHESFGEYDFASGTLPLVRDSVMKTRRLLLADAPNSLFCNDRVSLPLKIAGQLPEPLRMDGVDLTEEEARTVVAGLANEPGTIPPSRAGYGRYTVAITGGVTAPPASTVAGAEQVLPRLFVTLQNITLYEDPDFLRPFWSGQSSYRVNREQQGELDQLKFQGIDPTDSLQPENEKPLTTIGPKK